MLLLLFVCVWGHTRRDAYHTATLTCIVLRFQVFCVSPKEMEQQVSSGHWRLVKVLRIVFLILLCTCNASNIYILSQVRSYSCIATCMY